MLRIFPVLVEVQIGVGIEHGVLQLQPYGAGLAVHPLVLVEHGKLVGAGVGGVVAVVGEVEVGIEKKT